MQLKGLYTAMITPFDHLGNINEQGLRQNIRFQIQQGVDGIVLLGTTGEAPTLTHEEQKQIITIGVQEAKGKIPVIIGTGSYSTKQTIENTQLAQELGADAALVVTPYYNKPTQEGLFLHFQAISQAVNLPVIVYNIQGRTGQNLQTATLKRIADLPHIIGIKEASGNIAQIDEVIQTFSHRSDSFSILSGDDSLTFPLMALGGHGIISVVSNLIPRTVKEFVQLCENGNIEKARHLHQQLSFLFKEAFIETNPIPIKAMMNFCQMPAGLCRLPLCELTVEHKKTIEAVIHKIPYEWLNHG